MSLYRRVEPILVELRPMFAGFATFEWFVLLLWGVILYTLFIVKKSQRTLLTTLH
ncbi:MAG: hypothetical protein F6K26_47755 [Moorea sp. SIO2I5]|nr:hypothetical protein [Moorena sp. SIO2I5]